MQILWKSNDYSF
ncbi:unnamed protein product, partial [Rotaria magnacalcarata]